MLFILKSVWFHFKDPNYRNLLFASLFILFAGAYVYHEVEGWTYLDSLYFSIITLTTIGYGDFSPQTEFGKLFTIIYICIGVGLILTFINTTYAHFSEARHHVSRIRKERKEKLKS